MKAENHSQLDHIEATSSAVDDLQKPDLTLRHGVQEKNVESLALADAVAKDNPDYKSRSQVKLYCMMALCVLNGVMNGYDGSVMSAINAMEPFQDRFKIGKTGTLNGATFSIYTVGSIIGSLGCGYIMDRWGRRAGMFIGAANIILGSVLQATSIASWSCYATNYLENDWCWRIPYIIQLTFPTVVFSLVWFLLPESPRWLWSVGQTERAKGILIQYHGNMNPDSALVKLEVEEMQDALEHEQEIANKNWNYKVLVNTRANRHRMWLLMLVAVFANFIGGSVISYYLPVMVEGIGITDSRRQLLLNGINTILSFIAGLFGSFCVDKFGRRPLFLWGTFLTGLVYIPINVLAARAEGYEEGQIPRAQSYAFIAMVFTYGIFWGFCWTPLQALYPAEILNNEIRAKGMGVKGFLTGVSSFINTFGTSVSLKEIGWKTYTIFLVLHFIHNGLMWLSCVETKGRTLEELDEIFNDPHPVKRSKQKTAIIANQGVGIQIKDDA
ncbi:lactose permease [Verticillium alfalfae VaMs.102]|uniref:Lactose permease n=1 Tax=Verticillium alfalfae (strain VaMs.102 / ATCC MYA-4576 / FGSC 10136) TaxID=526221 RepID=C9SEC4_VERA1|nr:lactose permease [Verticillium alfalfae VaMs.102]EEY16517.1 lactose permease [Verticillium alfalfae VaMs.102]